MVIGFTGSQSGMTEFQEQVFSEILHIHNVTELHHGDCIGSDEIANKIALRENITIFTIHPPSNYNRRAFCFDDQQLTKFNHVQTEWKDYDDAKVRWCPVKPYLERNRNIVDTVEMLIATPKEYHHTLRSGTWATIRYAWQTKKHVVIIPPVDRPKEEEESFVQPESIRELDKEKKR